jgi:hypothetical protein
MRSKQIHEDGFFIDFPVAATTVIYKNSFVGLNATGYLTSYVAPAVYTGATATGTSFRGIALEHVASQTSDGDKTCRVMVDGYFEYSATGVALLNAGCPIFASDNATLNVDSTVGACIGYHVSYTASGIGVFKLVPQAQSAGHFLSVVSPIIDFPTVNQKILLVHETDNANGLLLCTCSAYTIEEHVCASTQGIVTIQHTADTSMGCTLTAPDNSVAFDSVVGAGGQLWAPASASDDAIVKAPAGKQVNAEVTTASAETTGTAKICATFLRL